MQISFSYSIVVVIATVVYLLVGLAAARARFAATESCAADFDDEYSRAADALLLIIGWPGACAIIVVFYVAMAPVLCFVLRAWPSSYFVRAMAPVIGFVISLFALVILIASGVAQNGRTL